MDAWAEPQETVAGPVRALPHERSQPLQDGMALCLSGGGYRAMVFHLGALLRLNEMRLLAQMKRISSVSGGSITAGLLGLKWSKLNFVNGVAMRLRTEVIDPIRDMALRTIDAPAIIGGALLPGRISEYVEHSYRKYLFRDATLQDLPDEPRFVINATNVQSLALWRFSKPYMGDYRVGLIDKPNVPLAKAVAASSAFPPVLSPVVLDVEPGQFRAGSGLDLQQGRYVEEVVLSDGGVYDNLGLETVWKRYQTVLVSDGGAKTPPEAEPKHDWPRHTIRTLEIIDNQVRSLRLRALIAAFEDRQEPHEGTYWGIRTDIRSQHVGDALDCDPVRTAELAAVRTRLKGMPIGLVDRLINWGYAICDAAIRRWRPSADAPLPSWPYPESPV
jgi:NTE family protein